MKAIKKNIIVAVNLSEKAEYDIILPSGLKLTMRSDYGYDGKVTNPVIAHVVSVGEDVEGIYPGDVLLTDYNTFTRYQKYITISEEEQKGIEPYGQLPEKHGDLDLFTIPSNYVWAKLDTEGNPVPLPTFLVVETIDKPEIISAVLEVITVDEEEKSYIPNTFKVIRAGTECDYVHNGDTVVAWDRSNVKFNYVWNEIKHECYIMMYEDVLGIKRA